MASVRSITVQVFNASDAGIVVNQGSLTGGDWEGTTMPMPGSVVQPATNISFVNGADNAFAALGGTILLTPASGGSINLSWTWARGSGVTGTATTTSLTGLAVTSSVINTQSLTPTMQVYITDTAAAQSLAS